jgi:hypothetical protein
LLVSNFIALYHKEEHLLVTTHKKIDNNESRSKMSLLKDTKRERPKNSAKLPKLTIQQQIDNNEVIERMNRKITYTKNQRHLGSTITYHEALNNTEK